MRGIHERTRVGADLGDDGFLAQPLVEFRDIGLHCLDAAHLRAFECPLQLAQFPPRPPANCASSSVNASPRTSRYCA